MAIFQRVRTGSQLANAADQLRSILEERIEENLPIEDDILELDPSFLEVQCKINLGTDTVFQLSEEAIALDKNFPDSIVRSIKEKILEQVGGTPDQNQFLGESDPWCKFPVHLSIKGCERNAKTQMASIPLNICYLTNLQTLELTNHLLMSFPTQISSLSELRTLRIENTRLKSLAELGSNLKLQSLIVDNNKLTTISRSLQGIPNIEEISAANNQIKDLYAEIALHTSLIRLNLSHNKLSKLGPEMKSLTRLEELNLSHNTLGSGLRNRTPLAPLSSFVSLVRLDLSDNKLTSIPSLDLVKNLAELNLSGNLLTAFPYLFQSSALKVLDLSNNQINTIPLDGFKGLVSLQKLNLSNNKFKIIPNAVSSLEILTELDLSKNQIPTLSDGLFSLGSLIRLDVSHNEIVVFSKDEILSSCWKNLRVLQVHHNRLARLPEDFFSLPSLEEVNLAFNMLREFPQTSSAGNLKRLYLYGNQFTVLPSLVSTFTSLEKLCLHENPLTALPTQFLDLVTLQILTITNLCIDASSRSVTVIPTAAQLVEREKKKASSKGQAQPDEEGLAEISKLIDLIELCPHHLMVFALSELCSDETYLSSFLMPNSEEFLLRLVSSSHNQVAVDAALLITKLAWNSSTRGKLQTGMLYLTLLALVNRPHVPLAVQALHAISYFCLDTNIANQQRKTTIRVCLEKESSSEHEEIRNAARKVLCILGYTEHIETRKSINFPTTKRRGIRILTMDGGGTKSVSTIMVLQEIERRTGKKIFELFDLIGGTSVGGILSCLLGIKCIDAFHVGELQKRFFKEIFSSGANNEGIAEKFALLSNFFNTGARYNTRQFETRLKENLTEESLIDSSARLDVTKVFVVSVLMNVFPPEPYLFRNYCYSPGRQSRYQGSCQRAVWEATRATSAAPSMFSECLYDNMRFSDGGMAVNNPTAIAYHEYLNIWGRDAPLDCIVSIGTGAVPTKNQSKGFKDFVLSVIESATTVNRINDVMEDFLPDKLHRFNVVDEAFDVILDETRDKKVQEMEDATLRYIDSVSDKMDALTKVLLGED